MAVQRLLCAVDVLGSFLRSFTFGHVRQLDAVSSGFLAGLAGRAPLLGPTGEKDPAPGLVFVDVDDIPRYWTPWPPMPLTGSMGSSSRSTPTSNTAPWPSGHFGANSARLVCAVMAYNPTRATGTFTRARTGTIRARLVAVPARIASSARQIRFRLPESWPWQHAFERLFTALHRPPKTA